MEQKRNSLPRGLLHLLVMGPVLLVPQEAIPDSSVPHDLRAAIIIRAVAYERGFAGRSSEAVVAIVGTVSGASGVDAESMKRMLDQLLSRTMIAKRKSRIVRVNHKSKEATAAALDSHDAEIVYIAAGSPSNLIEAIPTTKGAVKRILVCGNPDDVPRGCTLSVERADNKPRLVLNLKQINSVGLRFAPQLLKLARIIR